MQRQTRKTRSSHSPAATKGNGKGERWSKRVTQTSNALSLEDRVFTQRDPHKIALSLKRSAEQSHQRKAGPFQSAMSMLNFYINRAGKNLPAAKRSRLEKAKKELRNLYGRDPQGKD